MAYAPSLARTLAFGGQKGAGANAWPNKNPGDLLDYWLDATGQIAPGDSIAGVVAQISPADGSLVAVNQAASGQPASYATVQAGMIRLVLTGGVPGQTYTISVAVMLASGLLLNLAPKLTLAAAPAALSPLPGVQTVTNATALFALLEPVLDAPSAPGNSPA